MNFFYKFDSFWGIKMQHMNILKKAPVEQQKTKWFLNFVSSLKNYLSYELSTISYIIIME